MHWYILGERERLQSGEFVAVAVAFNEMEATLLRDYLREQHLSAHIVPTTPRYPLLDKIFIWVPAAKLQEAVTLLQTLAAEWWEEPADEKE
ncbi:MAG: hypothetical protein ABDI19_00265 [Armatimonadota bacterium]